MLARQLLVTDPGLIREIKLTYSFHMLPGAQNLSDLDVSLVCFLSLYIYK